MKVFILAGGLGTRISEYTESIPKPMIKIGKYPILIHIINIYVKFGIQNFYILTGYKSFVVKRYFKNFKKFGEGFKFKIKNKNIIITLVDTGKNTMTGGRLKKVSKYLNNKETFLFTYGDGVANINIKKLVNFHSASKSIITVTAVRPPARFGEILIKNKRVSSFKEKPQVREGWINGGFFVANKSFLKLIEGSKSILEKKPLEKAAKLKKFAAYKHHSFWKCMDTKRDKDELEKLSRLKSIPWMNF